MSDYNDKCFSGGVRGKLHRMRFEWLRRNLDATSGSYNLFELGCFDCRSLSYLPKPKTYVGADAGWEGGLNDAQMNFVKMPWIELVMARSVEDLAKFKDRQFEYAISLETLEHIPDAVLSGYLAFLARITTKKLLITVPVEVGPVFLAKHIAKRTVSGLESGDTETYTLAEIFWATMGRADRVRRFEHKGFDYRTLIAQLSEHFTITKIEGIPFPRFPYLSFQVGIVAEPKRPA